MFDPFLNVSVPITQADLEAQLSVLQKEYMTQQRIISTGAGDTNVAMQTVASIERAIELIYRKLNSLDPTNYPIDSIVRTDLTRINFANV